MDIHCFYQPCIHLLSSGNSIPNFWQGRRVGGLTTLTPSVHIVQIGLASYSRYDPDLANGYMLSSRGHSDWFR